MIGSTRSTSRRRSWRSRCRWTPPPSWQTGEHTLGGRKFCGNWSPSCQVHWVLQPEPENHKMGQLPISVNPKPNLINFTEDLHALKILQDGVAQIFSKIPGGQGYPDKNCQGVHYFGLNCSFINTSFEIWLVGGSLFTPLPPSTLRVHLWSRPNFPTPKTYSE